MLRWFHSLDFRLYYQKWTTAFFIQDLRSIKKELVSTVRVRTVRPQNCCNAHRHNACFHTGALAVFTLQPGLQKTTRKFLTSFISKCHCFFELFIPRIARNSGANTSNTINSTQSFAWDWRTCTRHWHFCQHLFCQPVPSNLPIDQFLQSWIRIDSQNLLGPFLCLFFEPPGKFEFVPYGKPFLMILSLGGQKFAWTPIRKITEIIGTSCEDLAPSLKLPPSQTSAERQCSRHPPLVATLTNIPRD